MTLSRLDDHGAEPCIVQCLLNSEHLCPGRSQYIHAPERGPVVQHAYLDVRIDISEAVAHHLDLIQGSERFIWADQRTSYNVIILNRYSAT